MAMPLPVEWASGLPCRLSCRHFLHFGPAVDRVLRPCLLLTIRLGPEGRVEKPGFGPRLWSEPPACHAAIPGGILPAGRCPQESGHGKPEAHSTGRTTGLAPPS